MLAAGRMGRGIMAMALLLVGTMTLHRNGWSMNMEKATLGGGCFWCLEAVYERIDGVKSVVSGYAGGTVAHPTYEQVCTGKTGHAEVVQVEYDPNVVGYERLLKLFWDCHDPTTLNRQGGDVGTQYRSVIFYHNEKQKLAAEKSKAAAGASGLFSDPIVTEILPLPAFYKAENYHQDYFQNNSNAPYCTFVIKPKLKKMEGK
jgi:methionine-S-sulfoxide reductase